MSVTELSTSLETTLRAIMPRLVQALETWQDNEREKLKMATVDKEQTLWDEVVRMNMSPASFGMPGTLDLEPGTRALSAIRAADSIIAARRRSFSGK